MSNTFYPGYIPGTETLDQVGIRLQMIDPLSVRLYPQFHVLNTLANRLGPAKEVESGNRIYKLPRMGNDYPAAVIQTGGRVSISSTILELTLTDSSFESFRVGDGIDCPSGSMAKVVAKSAGFLRVQFEKGSGSTTAFTSSDFAEGETVSWVGPLTSVYSQEKMERVQTFPFLYENCASFWMDTFTQTMDEMNALSYVHDDKGQKNYLRLGGKKMIERAAMARCKNNYIGGKVQNVGQGIYRGEGLKDQIKSAGIDNQYVTPIDETHIQSLVDRLMNSGAVTDKKFVIICGQSYLGDFQANVARPYNLTAGKNSVLADLGVSLKGLNVTSYYFEGADVDFVVDPTFSNANMYPGVTSSVAPGSVAMSRTAFWMNASPVQTEQEINVPFLRKYLSGPMGSDGKMLGMHVAEIPGQVDSSNRAISKPTRIGFDTTFAVSTFETLQTMNPYNCAFDYPL